MTILGIDIGGSGVKGAPVNISNGDLLDERFRLPTPHPATPKSVAKTVAKITNHFEWHGPIGCTLPGRIKNGIVQTAANIDERWIGTRADRLLHEATGCRATVLNDADAAGVAEMAFGAGRKRNGLVLVLTVGTGIGSAMFYDQVLVPNTELGHLELNGHDAERRAADSARKRDKITWEKWAKRFQKYLNHVEFLFAPDLLIIGGGVSRPKKFERFSSLLTTRAEVLPAQLQNEAGIIGAALSART